MIAEARAVLLVEDDPNDVMFFLRALRKLGVAWQIEVAQDGDEALRKLEDERRAITHVVLDLKIPKRNGFDVLQEIRHRSPEVRVVILTSSREKSDLDRASELGVDGYLIKPVSFTALLAVIEEIVAAWKAPGPESGGGEG